MTVGNCVVGETNVIATYPFDKYICEVQCKNSDTCQFWRAIMNSTMALPECVHLKTNYHLVSTWLTHQMLIGMIAG